MLEGLYSAAAGMAAEQQRMDALANDVANVSTNGYKQTRVGFRDLVYVQAAGGSAPGVLTGAGAAAIAGGLSTAQGSLQSTGEPLDLALEGRGFFEVRRADGTLALTRDGAFHTDASGTLVTARGERVQGVRGPIVLPRGTSEIAFRKDGAVLADGRAVGRLAIVNVPAPQQLAPVGDSLLVPTAASGAPAAARGFTVRQGMLEGSNVDLADTMTDLIDAQRSFELASRAIQTQDQMLEIANGVKR